MIIAVIFLIILVQIFQAGGRHKTHRQVGQETQEKLKIDRFLDSVKSISEK